MDAEAGTRLKQGVLQLLKVSALQVVLRVVVALAAGVFDKIDDLCGRHFGILLYEPWEGVDRVAADVGQGIERLAYLAAVDAAEEAPQVAVLGDSVDVVGEVDMAVARRGHIKFEVLHEDMRVLVDDGYLQAVAVAEDGVAGAETTVLVPLVVEQFFGAGDEEERVVDEVGTDDSRLAVLFHLRATHVGQYKAVAQEAVGHNDHGVLLPLLLVGCVSNALRSLGVAVEEELLDVVDNRPNVRYGFHIRLFSMLLSAFRLLFLPSFCRN